MFRQMLMASAMRLLSPEDDQGYEEPDDAPELGDEFEEDEVDLEDDPEGGDPPEGAEQEDEAPQRRPSRGEQRFQTLSQQVREANERAERAERAANELQSRQSSTSNADAQRIRAERLANMSEGERLEFMFQEGQQQTQQQIRTLEFNNWESGDKADFRAMCGGNPAVAKLADKVEAELVKMRAAGQNAPRETIAKYLLGEAALARAPRAAAKGARTAAAGRERQQGRPGASRSDVAATGNRKGGEAAQRRARLENVEI